MKQSSAHPIENWGGEAIVVSHLYSARVSAQEKENRGFKFWRLKKKWAVEPNLNILCNHILMYILKSIYLSRFI